MAQNNVFNRIQNFIQDSFAEKQLYAAGALSLIGATLMAFSVPAIAQDMPAGADAGAILNHHQQTQRHMEQERKNQEYMQGLQKKAEKPGISTLSQGFHQFTDHCVVFANPDKLPVQFGVTPVDSSFVVVDETMYNALVKASQARFFARFKVANAFSEGCGVKFDTPDVVWFPVVAVPKMP